MQPTSMPQKNLPLVGSQSGVAAPLPFHSQSSPPVTWLKPRWKQRLQVAPLIFYNCLKKKTKIALSNRNTDSLMKKLSFWESRHLFRCFFVASKQLSPESSLRIPSFLVSHLDEIGIYQNRSLFKNYDGWLPDFVGWGKTWCVLFWRLRGCALPESNNPPENRQSQRNFIFQPLIFKGYDLLVSGRAVPNKNSQADFDRWVVATLLHPSSSALLHPSVFALAQTRKRKMWNQIGYQKMERWWPVWWFLKMNEKNNIECAINHQITIY